MRIGVRRMTEDALPSNKTAGAVAVTASTAAVACGICCVLPFALPAALLGSVGGTLALFADAYRWLTPIAVVSVLAGWAWVIYQSVSTGRRPARSTLVLMIVATVAMVVALLWPNFEESLIAALR
jgi:hypothetical protein